MSVCKSPELFCLAAEYPSSKFEVKLSCEGFVYHNWMNNSNKRKNLASLS